MNDDPMKQVPMNKDGSMNDHNHDIPGELLELDAALHRLGRAERESAPAGFEHGLQRVIAGEVTPEPIPMPVAVRSRRWIGLAAGVLLVGSVGILTWVSSGVMGQQNKAVAPSGGAISVVALSEDVDLLLELVETDFNDSESDSAWSFGSDYEDLAFDVLQLDSELEPEWDSLDSMIDPFLEGAI